MKTVSILALLSLFIVVRATAQERGRTNFDDDWYFHKGDIAMKRAIKTGRQGGLTDANVKVATGVEDIAYTDRNKTPVYKTSDWKAVSLPHDWMVEEAFVHDDNIGSYPGSNGYHPGGIGFYRKEFDIPESDKGKKIFIDFDGIFRNSSVWVNGHYMGNHQSGYTPSHYDVTDVLRYGSEGKNVILVKVDATEVEGWWYEGAGIYRHVWLTKTNRLHVGRFGTFVTTPTISDQQAVVNIATTLKNEYDTPKNITLVSTIVDSKRHILNTQTTSKAIPGLSSETIEQKETVQNPKLWSPETPHLYKVKTEVKENDKTIDDYETTFGIRTAEVRRDGFYLNGKLYPIKGTANHQDFAGVGVALPNKINAYKIKLLKQMGSNGYRAAHNPPTPELLDICDSLGMLVLDENRQLSSTEDGMKDLAELIYRDRNHPSVFMWNMENEEPLQGTPMGARILKTMVDFTHKADPTRQTTAAMNHGWNTGGYSDLLDVVGYNYGQRDMQYVKDHEKYPKRKMIVTESTSFVATRGEYADDKEKGYVSNLGEGVSWGVLPGKDWDDIVKYPYLSGMFAWTGFDYGGEPTPYKWPCVTSHFGIMDLCGFPKDGYYAYKAAWGNEPVVHVFPHWNWPGKEGQKIKVGGYSNCDEIELLVNGKSIGRKKAIPFNRMEWEVEYEPGKLEARGYKAGKLVTNEIIETTTAPTRLSVSSDVPTLKADGADVAIINISVKDANGRVVPVADNLVQFSVEGPGRIIGTGNGNPSSHEPDKANQRKAFNGYCQVLVQSDKTQGIIRLRAASETLKSAEVVVKVE